MASRISWLGLGVGALTGGIIRVAVAAVHFPGILQEPYPMVLVPALLGIITGGVAAATGRILRGAVVGGGLSFLFYLVSLPLVGVMAFLGAATPFALWETLLVGVAPGAIGGAVAQLAATRKGNTASPSASKTP